MRRVSLSELARREHAARVLSVIREAGYDMARVREVIGRRIEKLKKAKMELEQMSEEEFRRRVSRMIFGVALKGYYIEKLEKTIEEYEGILKEIESLLKYYVSDRQFFDWHIKEYYKGYVREAREAFRRLASAKITSFGVIE